MIENLCHYYQSEVNQVLFHQRRIIDTCDVFEFGNVDAAKQFRHKKTAFLETLSFL